MPSTSNANLQIDYADNKNFTTWENKLDSGVIEKYVKIYLTTYPNSFGKEDFGDFEITIKKEAIKAYEGYKVPKGGLILKGNISYKP